LLNKLYEVKFLFVLAQLRAAVVRL